MVFRRDYVYRVITSGVSHQNKLSFFAAKRKIVSVGVELGKSVKHRIKNPADHRDGPRFVL